MIRSLPAALLLALSMAAMPAALAAAATPGVAPASTSESAADAAFRAIYTKEWAWRRVQQGAGDEDSAAEDGNLTPKLPDVSPAVHEAVKETAAALKAAVG